MFDIYEIKHAFRERVHPKLATLEQERLFYAVIITLLNGLVFVAIGLGLWYWGKDVDLLQMLSEGGFLVFIVIPAFFLVKSIIYNFITLIGYIIKTFILQNFVFKHKSILVTQFLESYAKDFTYKPHSYISEQRIKALQMFPEFSNYFGNDYIEGDFFGHHIEFSEAIFGKEVPFSYKEFLHGLIYMTDVDLDKEFSLTLVPASNIDNYVKGPKEDENYARREDRFSIEDDDFETVFRIYGNQTSLSTTLKETLLQIHKKFQDDIYINVHQRKLTLFFREGDGTFFEPKLYRSLKNNQDTITFFEHFQNLITVKKAFGS